jgi:hypothetical protein
MIPTCCQVLETMMPTAVTDLVWPWLVLEPTLAADGKDLPKWNTESAMGMYGIVAGFDETVDPVIDMALK